MRFPLPPHVNPRENRQPVPLRDAATVVLLRDRGEGLETYLLRRQATLEFAAGAYVFPGGGVHDSDYDPIAWVGPDPEQWSVLLGCEPDRAAAIVVAAIRETFEESGILLAGTGPDDVLSDVSSEAFAAARLDLDADRRSFADFLAEHRLVLRTDLLGPWAHWITPDFEVRRYDTRFLVAVVPQGQRVGSLPGEADRRLWARLTDVVAAHQGREALMLPPTISTVESLVELRLDEVLPASRERRLRPLLPRIIEIDGEFFVDVDLED